uniref:Uncharacterized protein n=1 Tax=Setaria italica TaxID=4555 RepID=K3Z1Y7_SETIT
MHGLKKFNQSHVLLRRAYLVIRHTNRSHEII